MASVHELIPSIGNNATRIAVVSTLALVVLSAVFILNQVPKLDRNPIEEALEELLIFMPSNAFAEEPTDYESKKARAQDVYNDAIIRAKAIYQQITDDKNADDEEKARANQVFTQALLDAKAEYEKTLAEIKTETTYTTVKEARDAYHQIVLDAKTAYEKAIAEAIDDEEISTATQDFNKTVLDAREAYEKVRAELEGRE
jgi:hypothetical protein